MRVKPEGLDQCLNQGLQPVYLVSGDEPLLSQTSADAIRARARKNGFEERQVLEVNRQFSWRELGDALSLNSLFSSRRLVELRLPNGKPGREGSDTLARYCANTYPDVLLLIISGKLDASALKSKWVKSIESAGIHVQVWPLEGHRLAGWIRQRLQQAGLEASPDSIRLLIEMAEGNLLAIHQEIEKLQLVHAGTSNTSLTREMLTDNSRYTPFHLVDSCLEGKTRRSLRVLDRLREDGIEPPIILWALTRELRELCKPHASGQRMPGPPARQKRLNQARQRLSQNRAHQLIQQAYGIDRMIKGLDPADPWVALAGLSRSICAPPSI